MERTLTRNTRIGVVQIRECDGFIVRLILPPVTPAAAEQATGLLERAFGELAEYLDGGRREFDLPLRPEGTAFQQLVWGELRKIPYGETVSYGTLARRIGRPGAARAVGLANHNNPVAIFIPCHRVIGADGSLVGFGAGLPLKAWLLNLEAETVRRS